MNLGCLFVNTGYSSPRGITAGFVLIDSVNAEIDLQEGF